MHSKSFIILMVLGFVLLFGYQNCGDAVGTSPFNSIASAPAKTVLNFSNITSSAVLSKTVPPQNFDIQGDCHIPSGMYAEMQVLIVDSINQSLRFGGTIEFVNQKCNASNKFEGMSLALNYPYGFDASHDQKIYFTLISRAAYGDADIKDSFSNSSSPYIWQKDITKDFTDVCSGPCSFAQVANLVNATDNAMYDQMAIQFDFTASASTSVLRMNAGAAPAFNFYLEGTSVTINNVQTPTFMQKVDFSNMPFSALSMYGGNTYPMKPNVKHRALMVFIRDPATNRYNASMKFLAFDNFGNIVNPDGGWGQANVVFPYILGQNGLSLATNGGVSAPYNFYIKLCKGSNLCKPNGSSF